MHADPAIRGETAAAYNGEQFRRMVYWYCRDERHAAAARAEGGGYWRRLFDSIPGAHFAPIPTGSEKLPLYDLNNGNFPGMLPAWYEAQQLAAMRASLLKDPWHAKNIAEEGDEYVKRLRMSCPMANFLPHKLGEPVRYNEPDYSYIAADPAAPPGSVGAILCEVVETRKRIHEWNCEIGATQKGAPRTPEQTDELVRRIAAAQEVTIRLIAAQKREAEEGEQ